MLRRHAVNNCDYDPGHGRAYGNRSACGQYAARPRNGLYGWIQGCARWADPAGLRRRTSPRGRGIGSAAVFSPGRQWCGCAGDRLATRAGVCTGTLHECSQTLRRREVAVHQCGRRWNMRDCGKHDSQISSEFARRPPDNLPGWAGLGVTTCTSTIQGIRSIDARCVSCQTSRTPRPCTGEPGLRKRFDRRIRIRYNERPIAAA